MSVVVLDPERAADHLSRLYGLAWALCGSRHLAEDLTQETYARVLARPRRLRAGNEFQYLAQTLRNVAADHWRADRRRPEPAPGWDLVDEPATTGDPEAAAIAGDVAGLTYAEAAKTLRIPDGTVMSRLFRARARLAGVLA
jgi:RNA polymerase sigma-70 factor (ECF subfamily)